MSSSKTISKGIRIKNEVAEYFDGKPLNRYVESMYELIQSGEIEEYEDCIGVHTKNKKEEKECAHHNIEDTTPKIEEKTMKDIDQMCGFFGIGIEDFFEELCKSMNSGEISYEGGVFRGKTEIDVENFMESCHRANRDAQEMIDKCAQMIERSRI